MLLLGNLEEIRQLADTSNDGITAAMYLKSVYIRFYKSFNFDYLRKVHPNAEKCQWEDLDGLWFPHVRVPLDPLITTIVGANESGKSHLLSAIEKAIVGKGLAPHDICRYSPFFSVENERRHWPQLGLEWADVTDVEAEQLAQLLEADLGHFDRFLMFRTEPNKAVIYVPGEEEPPVPRDMEGESLNHLSEQILPRPFRINPTIALPDSIPIAWLGRTEGETIPAAKLSRKRRMRLVDQFAALPPAWITNESTVQQNAANLFKNFFEPITDQSGSDSSFEESLDLARALLLKVANVDPMKLRELYSAVENGREGYANGLIEMINKQLEKQLNFPRWWVQDRNFLLRLDLRESDLVFTVRDRTGTDYTFGERSSGLRYFLSYYVQYKAHDRSTDHSEILLMDEPDAYLSAEAQQDLLKIFHSFAKPDDYSRPIQVVYVTHSPFLIDKNHSERIRVLEKGSGREGTRVVANASRNHYEPLRSAFGAFVGETAFVGSCNLVLEGQADQILIAGAANLIARYSNSASSETLDLNRVTLVPAGSAGHIPYVVYLARGRDAYKPAVLVLLDSDDAGRNAAKQLRREKRSGAKLLGERYVVLLGDVDGLRGTNSGSFEIEDLVPVTLAARAANKYFEDLAAFRGGGAPELHEKDIATQLADSVGIFSALEQTVSQLSSKSDWHVEKIGFARSVIDCCEQELQNETPDADVLKFLENMKKLFSKLNRLRRLAERELLQERIESKVERLKNKFAQDYPSSATREDARFFFEELEEELDDSRESDAIKAKIMSITRDFQLNDDVAENVPNFDRFLQELDALKYEPLIRHGKQ